MWDSVQKLIAPFLWGGALALFLNLPLCWLEEKLATLLPHSPRLRRGLSLGLLWAVLVGAIGVGLWLLVPQLLAAATQLTAALPDLVDRITRWLSGGAAEEREGRAVLLHGLQRLDEAGGSALDAVLQTGMSALVGAAGKAGDLLLAVMLAVYLLADKEGLARRAALVVRAVIGAQQAAQAEAFFRRAQQVFSRFVVGQCVEAVILAGLFVLVLFVFGFPNVLPIATVVGVTALVPVFGAFAGCAVGVVLVLPYGVEKAGWFVLLFLCVQQLENNLIYPHVVGGRIGLPPLWVLVAVILGGGLFGVAGLVLGIPAVSVVYHLGREWVHSRLAAQQEKE